MRMLLVLTIYYILRHTSSAHNKRLDLLSGEDLVGGQKIKTFVRSDNEDNSDTIYTSSNVPSNPEGTW